MGKSSSGRSKNGSEVSSRSERKRNEEDNEESTKSRNRQDSATTTPTSSSKRKSSRRDQDNEYEERNEEYATPSRNYSSSSRNPSGGVAPSEASTYATAYTHDPDDYSRPSGIMRSDSMKDTDGRDERRESRRESKHNSKSERSRGIGDSDDESRNVGRKDSERDRDRDKDRDRDGRRESRKSSSKSDRKSSSKAYDQHDAALPQNQFPGEMPDQYTGPYRPPGFASQYYGDQGQSVSNQPGVRPQQPSIVYSADQAHLMQASAVPNPPPEPSSMGQAGAASSFYAGGSGYADSAQSTPSKPDKRHSLKTGRQSKSGTSPRGSPAAQGGPSVSGGGISGMGSAAMATGVGAAADYYTGHIPITTEDSAGKDNGGGGSSSYQVASPDSYANSSRPPNMSGQGSHHYGSAAAVGLGAAAAGAYYAGHGHQNSAGSGQQQYAHGHNQSFTPGHNHSAFPAMQQRKRQKQRGPLGKLVNWFKDPDGVAEFEQYTEAIGVCKYCFDPNSSPMDAPRRHHYHGHRTSTGNRHGSNTRVDKIYRHSSSDDDKKRRRSSAKKVAAAGVVGYGAAKIGEAIYNQRNDFDDTYSVKSGRPTNASRVSFMEDQESYKVSKKSRYASTEDLRSEKRESRHKSRRESERYEKKSSGRRSSSSSSSDHGISRGAALSAGAAVGAAVASGRRRSRSRSRSPVRRKRSYYSKRISPRHSYVDLSTTNSGPAGFGGFFNSPSANQKKGKKSKGFFNFANASSSSSDADLAFGEGTVKRRDSKKGKTNSRQSKKDDGFGSTAAILGLAATGMALADESDRRKQKGKERRDTDKYTGREQRSASGRRISMNDHETTTDGENDPAWEDLKDDDQSDGSVDTTLAYGGRLSAKQSRESLAEQGTSKWDWRWNKGKERRRKSSDSKPNEYRVDPALAALAGAGAGMAAARVMSEASTPFNRNNDLPPMRVVHPVATTDSTFYDVRPASQLTGTSPSSSVLPQVIATSGSIPLAQPQPVVPIASVPEAFGRLERDVTTSFSPQIPPYDERESSQNEYRSRKRRDSSPAKLPSREARGNVSFSLTQEQIDAESRAQEKEERRRIRRQERERRKSADATSIPKDTAEAVSEPPERRRQSSADIRAAREAEIEAELQKLYEADKELSRQRKEREAEHKRKVETAGVAAVAAAVGAGSVAAAVTGKDKSDSESDRDSKTRRKSSMKRGKEREVSPDPGTETQQERIARMAARRVRSTPSPVHENYSTFFVPADVAEHVKEHNEKAEHRDDEVDINVLEIIPGQRNKKKDPFDPFNYRPFGFEPDDDPTLHPWPVPRLGLVEPTPPASRVHSKATTPVLEPVKEPWEEEVDQILEEKRKSGSKVTWGDHDTVVYEVETPEDERSGFVPTQAEGKRKAPATRSGSETLTKVFTLDDDDAVVDQQAEGRDRHIEPEIIEAVPRFAKDDDIPDAPIPGAFSPVAEVLLEDILGGPGSFYQKPFAEEVNVLDMMDGHSGDTAKDIPRTGHGFVEDDSIPPTPMDEIPRRQSRSKGSANEDASEKDVTAGPRLSKSERRRLERAASSNDNVPETVAKFEIDSATKDSFEKVPERATDSVFDYLVDGKGDSVPAVSSLGAVAGTILSTEQMEDSSSRKQRNRTSEVYVPSQDREVEDFANPKRSSTFDDESKFETPRSKSKSGYTSDPEGWEESSSTKQSKDKRKASSKSDADFNPKLAMAAAAAAAAAFAAGREESSTTDKPKARKSKKVEDVPDDDDTRSIASSSIRDPEKKSRRKSKRDSEVFDDDDSRSIASSPPDSRKKSSKEKDKKPSGGIFSALFSSNRSDVSASSKKSSKSVKSESRADKERNEDGEKRKKRKSKEGKDFDDLAAAVSEPTRESRSETLPTTQRQDRPLISRDQSVDDGFVSAEEDVEGSRDRLDTEESFLAERPDMPPRTVMDMPMATDGVSGLKAERDLTDAVTAMGTVPVTPAHARYDNAPTAREATSRSASEDDLMASPEQTLPSSRRLSSIRTSNIASSPIVASSPTAIPINFRRPPFSPATHQRGFVNSPDAAPQSPPAVPRTRQNRPKSTEFRSGKEFRPLYLVQTNNAKVAAPAQEELEGLPSLPSSRAPSTHASIEDLRGEALAAEQQDYFTPERITPESFRERGRRHSSSYWNEESQKRRESPDYLDSRSATPVPADVQRARDERITAITKERPKYEFHSPSELLQDPSMYAEQLPHDLPEPPVRVGSPLPSVVSTDVDQDFMSARGGSPSPVEEGSPFTERPRSRSRSRSKSRRRSNPLTAAGLGLVGGTALGLAASEILGNQRNLSKSRRDVVEQNDMYGVEKRLAMQDPPPRGQPTKGRDTAFTADQPTNLVSERDASQSKDQDDFSPVVASTTKSKKDKKKNRQSYGWEDTTAGSGVAEMEEPVATPETVVVDTSANAFSKDNDTSVNGPSAVRDLDSRPARDTEAPAEALTIVPEPEIPAEEGEQWAVPAKKSKKDKKKKRQTLDFDEPSTPVAEPAIPTAQEETSGIFDVPRESNFVDHDRFSMPEPVESSAIADVADTQDRGVVSVPDTPADEIEEWSTTAKKSKKDKKKKRKTLDFDDLPAPAAEPALEPEPLVSRIKAVDQADQESTRNVKFVSEAVLPGATLTEEPDTVHSPPNQAKVTDTEATVGAEAVEDEWGMPVKKSKKDKKKSKRKTLDFDAPETLDTEPAVGIQLQETPTTAEGVLAESSSRTDTEPISEIRGIVTSSADIYPLAVAAAAAEVAPSDRGAQEITGDRSVPEIPVEDLDEWAVPTKKSKKSKKKSLNEPEPATAAVDEGLASPAVAEPAVEDDWATFGSLKKGKKSKKGKESRKESLPAIDTDSVDTSMARETDEPLTTLPADDFHAPMIIESAPSDAAPDTERSLTDKKQKSVGPRDVALGVGAIAGLAAAAALSRSASREKSENGELFEDDPTTSISERASRTSFPWDDAARSPLPQEDDDDGTDMPDLQRQTSYVPTLEQINRSGNDLGAFEEAFERAIYVRGLKGNTTREDAMAMFLPRRNNAPFVAKGGLTPIGERSLNTTPDDASPPVESESFGRDEFLVNKPRKLGKGKSKKVARQGSKLRESSLSEGDTAPTTRKFADQPESLDTDEKEIASPTVVEPDNILTREFLNEPQNSYRDRQAEIEPEERDTKPAAELVSPPTIEEDVSAPRETLQDDADDFAWTAPSKKDKKKKRKGQAATADELVISSQPPEDMVQPSEDISRDDAAFDQISETLREEPDDVWNTTTPKKGKKGKKDKKRQPLDWADEAILATAGAATFAQLEAGHESRSVGEPESFVDQSIDNPVMPDISLPDESMRAVSETDAARTLTAEPETELAETAADDFSTPGKKSKKSKRKSKSTTFDWSEPTTPAVEEEAKELSLDQNQPGNLGEVGAVLDNTTLAETTDDLSRDVQDDGETGDFVLPGKKNKKTKKGKKSNSMTLDEIPAAIEEPSTEEPALAFPAEDIEDSNADQPVLPGDDFASDIELKPSEESVRESEMMLFDDLVSIDNKALRAEQDRNTAAIMKQAEPLAQSVEESSRSIDEPASMREVETPTEALEDEWAVTSKKKSKKDKKKARLSTYDFDEAEPLVTAEPENDASPAVPVSEEFTVADTAPTPVEPAEDDWSATPKKKSKKDKKKNRSSTFDFEEPEAATTVEPEQATEAAAALPEESGVGDTAETPAVVEDDNWSVPPKQKSKKDKKKNRSSTFDFDEPATIDQSAEAVAEVVETPMEAGTTDQNKAPASIAEDEWAVTPKKKSKKDKKRATDSSIPDWEESTTYNEPKVGAADEETITASDPVGEFDQPKAGPEDEWATTTIKQSKKDKKKTKKSKSISLADLGDDPEDNVLPTPDQADIIPEEVRGDGKDAEISNIKGPLTSDIIDASSEQDTATGIGNRTGDASEQFAQPEIRPGETDIQEFEPTEARRGSFAAAQTGLVDMSSMRSADTGESIPVIAVTQLPEHRAQEQDLSDLITPKSLSASEPNRSLEEPGSDINTTQFTNDQEDAFDRAVAAEPVPIVPDEADDVDQWSFKPAKKSKKDKKKSKKSFGFDDPDSMQESPLAEEPGRTSDRDATIGEPEPALPSDTPMEQSVPTDFAMGTPIVETAQPNETPAEEAEDFTWNVGKKSKKDKKKLKRTSTFDTQSEFIEPAPETESVDTDLATAAESMSVPESVDKQADVPVAAGIAFPSDSQEEAGSRDVAAQSVESDFAAQVETPRDDQDEFSWTTGKKSKKDKKKAKRASTFDEQPIEPVATQIEDFEPPTQTSSMTTEKLEDRLVEEETAPTALETDTFEDIPLPVETPNEDAEAFGWNTGKKSKKDKKKSKRSSVADDFLATAEPDSVAKAEPLPSQDHAISAVAEQDIPTDLVRESAPYEDLQNIAREDVTATVETPVGDVNEFSWSTGKKSKKDKKKSKRSSTFDDQPALEEPVPTVAIETPLLEELMLDDSVELATAEDVSHEPIQNASREIDVPDTAYEAAAMSTETPLDEAEDFGWTAGKKNKKDKKKSKKSLSFVVDETQPAPSTPDASGPVAVDEPQPMSVTEQGFSEEPLSTTAMSIDEPMDGGDVQSGIAEAIVKETGDDFFTTSSSKKKGKKDKKRKSLTWADSDLSTPLAQEADPFDVVENTPKQEVFEETERQPTQDQELANSSRDIAVVEQTAPADEGGESFWGSITRKLGRKEKNKQRGVPLALDTPTESTTGKEEPDSLVVATEDQIDSEVVAVQDDWAMPAKKSKKDKKKKKSAFEFDEPSEVVDPANTKTIEADMSVEGEPLAKPPSRDTSSTSEYQTKVSDTRQPSDTYVAHQADLVEGTSAIVKGDGPKTISQEVQYSIDEPITATMESTTAISSQPEEPAVEEWEFTTKKSKKDKKKRKSVPGAFDFGEEGSGTVTPMVDTPADAPISTTDQEFVQPDNNQQSYFADRDVAAITESDQAQNIQDTELGDSERRDIDVVTEAPVDEWSIPSKKSKKDKKSKRKSTADDVSEPSSALPVAAFGLAAGAAVLGATTSESMKTKQEAQAEDTLMNEVTETDGTEQPVNWEDDPWGMATSSKKSKKDKKKKKQDAGEEFYQELEPGTTLPDTVRGHDLVTESRAIVDESREPSATFDPQPDMMDPHRQPLVNMEAVAQADTPPASLENDEWAVSAKKSKKDKKKKRQSSYDDFGTTDVAAPISSELAESYPQAPYEADGATVMETENVPTTRDLGEDFMSNEEHDRKDMQTSEELNLHQPEDPSRTFGNVVMSGKKAKKDKKKNRQLAFDDNTFEAYTPVVEYAEPAQSAFNDDSMMGGSRDITYTAEPMEIERSPDVQEEPTVGSTQAGKEVDEYDWLSSTKKSKKDKKKRGSTFDTSPGDQFIYDNTAEEASIGRNEIPTEPLPITENVNDLPTPTREIVEPIEDEWAQTTKKSKKDKKKKRQSEFVGVDVADAESPRSVEQLEEPTLETPVDAEHGMDDFIGPHREHVIMTPAAPGAEEEAWSVDKKKSKKDKKKKRESTFDDIDMVDASVSTPADAVMGFSSTQTGDNRYDRSESRALMGEAEVNSDSAAALTRADNDDGLWTTDKKKSKKDKKKKKSIALEDEPIQVSSPIADFESGPTSLEFPYVRDEAPGMQEVRRDSLPNIVMQHPDTYAGPTSLGSPVYGAVTMHDSRNYETPEDPQSRDINFSETTRNRGEEPIVPRATSKKSKRDKQGKKASRYDNEEEVMSSGPLHDTNETSRAAPVSGAENEYQVPDQESDTGSNVSASTRERRKRRRSPPIWTGEEPADLPRDRALTPPPDHDDIMDTALVIAAGLGFGASEHNNASTSRAVESESTRNESGWSFGNIPRLEAVKQQTNRDSGVQFTDSPSLGRDDYNTARDSGYVPSPVVRESWGHDRREEDEHHEPAQRPPRPRSPTSSSEDVIPRDRKLEHASRSSRELPRFEAPSSRSIAGERGMYETPMKRQPSPVTSTSKDRSSALFNSSPADQTPRGSVPEHSTVLQTPSGLHRTPSIHGHGHGRDRSESHASRNSHESSRERRLSEDLASNLLQRPVLSEVDRSAFSPLSPPGSDRPFSPVRSPLHPIPEDSHRSISGEMGAAAGLAAVGLTGAAMAMAGNSRDPPATSEPKSLGRSKSRTSSLRNLRDSTTSPFNDPSVVALNAPAAPIDVSEQGESAARPRDMAETYDGYGAYPGSPRSPTRPPSVRKRQSMQQIRDLETRVDQLANDNRALAEAKLTAERHLEEFHLDRNRAEFATEKALRTATAQLRERDEELVKLRQEIAALAATHESLKGDHEQRYSVLQDEHSQAQNQWQESSRELETLRSQHDELSTGMEEIVRHEIDLALAQKNIEIERLYRDLELAKEKIRQLQAEILDRGANEVIQHRDEDYFDTACQQLCQHVQQWVLRFSKFSDSRVCRTTNEVRDEKIVDRFDNVILDGSDVDVYLGDRIKRRDVFMSVVMTMIWEYVFTRYLFGMDRDQRQKLKQLEKNLSEVGPTSAVHQWRAMTLTLLAKRESFKEQRENDTEAVAIEIFSTLSRFLPPPQNLEAQIQDSLRNVMRAAVDLSIEMRTQISEYVMLPPLQPEYDTNGDLARKVFFNASLMNERSGEFSSNDELEAQQAVVRMVLFPLVVKKEGDSGEEDEKIVVCPAQVLVARPDKGKRSRTSGRIPSGGSVDARSLRATSTHSLAMSGIDMSGNGNMI